MELKIIRLTEDAILPKYAHADDSGMDLFSTEAILAKAGETVLVSTGIKIELPKDTEAQIRPRSGLALKNGIGILNTPGTIDEGYRGEIKIILTNFSKVDFQIEKGMKIAQMVIMPVLRPKILEVKELTGSVRGEGGFGSTGV